MKVLYISYDGMTDPLGQSQVIPYVIGLSKEGYEFTILSFEKSERMQRNESYIREILAANNILWVPLNFTRKPPVLSKFYDAVRMRQTAIQLFRKHGYGMVHCRSYIASDIGVLLKRKFGVKFLFDMRGFWADEKKDGGAWDQGQFLYRRVYNYYKRKERTYIESADAIISLTEAGKKEMGNWGISGIKADISVIPCCADMDLFSVTSDAEKKKSRESLGLPQNSIVVSYLGSVGAWYMVDEMLRFFQLLRSRHPESYFLILTHSDPAIIEKKLPNYQLSKNNVIIREAQRSEVPFLMKSSDVSISFIKPVYSKISSCPTKLGETLSMGIPVICNIGIGDVESIVDQAGAGVVLSAFNDQEYFRAIDALPELMQKEPETIRTASARWFDLQKGIEMYKSAYKTVLKEPV